MPNNERLDLVLQTIVELYIKTARPVGSKALVEDGGLNFSPATIRNDMALLEEHGLITQPHTSAGRIPTEKGYHQYIEKFLPAQQKALSARQKEEVEAVRALQRKRSAEDKLIREIAHRLSVLTNEAVLISVGGRGYVTAGISNVFRKPEFVQHAELMLELGDMLDNLDTTMHALEAELEEDDVEVFIGKDNPVAQQTSIVVSEYHLPHGKSVVGILGPTRMDYGTNIAILKYMEELLND